MTQRKPKLEVKNPRLSPVIEISDMDEKMIYLVGWPGYRTTRGKSGLGYVESKAELAHMQGLFIRWMFTGKFRTHNPVYLLFMFAFGFLCGVAPLIGIFIQIFVWKEQAIPGFLLVLSPYMAVGNAIFVNALLSIWDWNGKSITGD